jgi:proteasome lid subunit RPN8/RPN11
MSILHLPAGLRVRIEDWVHAGYPSETCGLLLGRQNDLGARVCDVVVARNLNTDRSGDRFELDPRDFIKADQAAREAGLELVGVWHSHPDHPSRPSATDLELAWEGWSYLILSVKDDGVKDMQSWRLVDGKFVEEEIGS